MRLVSRALIVSLPIVAGFALSLPAVAQEDSMRQQYEDLKTAVGMGQDRPPIDFSERPPLAVPPSYNLPPPGTGPTTLGVNDPDEMARRKALSDARRPVPPTDPGAGATGLSARTYLIDPPSGMRDPSAVAAGIQTDGSAPAKASRHHAKRTAAQ